MISKRFRRSDAAIINGRLTEEVRSEARNQAIELVEKLPESMLDEAVKVLKSLSVKAKTLK